MIDRPRILCVDDELAVLEGLTLNLRKHFKISTATSGAEGLEAIKKDNTFAVVLSDMRMPKMNGAAFLSHVREAAPDSVRMLLTGQTDIASAVSAINEGQIFRFLTKPCPPDQLLKAFEAAKKQHQLITSERVLLEETLHGSIKALMGILALTNPMAFGRAGRVKDYVSRLLQNLSVADAWQVEVAAMVSELGCITLPPKTAEKLYKGEDLTHEEEGMVERMPAVVQKLLGDIPRLESVMEIISSQHDPLIKHGKDCNNAVPFGAKILRVVTDYDKLETQNYSPELALGTMRLMTERYDSEVLEIFFKLLGEKEIQNEVFEIPIREVKVGMVFTEDVLTKTGVLFVSHGYEVAESFVERAKNFQKGAIKEPVKVIIPAAKNVTP
ncbi:MAG: HD domain-containing phosphohydrolase [Nitrospiria bacterium]